MYGCYVMCSWLEINTCQQQLTCCINHLLQLRIPPAIAGASFYHTNLQDGLPGNMLPVHTHRILQVLRNFCKLSQHVLLLSLSAGKYLVGFQSQSSGLPHSNTVHVRLTTALLSVTLCGVITQCQWVRFSARVNTVCLHSHHAGSGDYPIKIQWASSYCSPAPKLPGPKTDHSTLQSAMEKNMQSYASTPHASSRHVA